MADLVDGTRLGLPELAGRIRASPAEERTAVLGWRDGVGGAAGAWELTFGARNFDGPEAGNGGKWAWQHFSDETYVEGGSFGHGRYGMYGQDSRGDEVAAVVNGVVEALRSRPEKGALLVIVDPLLNSGAAGLYLFGYAFIYFFTQLDMVGGVGASSGERGEPKGGFDPWWWTW